MEDTEYYIETSQVVQVDAHPDMVPEKLHKDNGQTMHVQTAGRVNGPSISQGTNLYETDLKYPNGEEPNPSQGKGINERGEYHTLWEYQGQEWPRVEASTNSEARYRQVIAAAQAAEEAAAVAGTSKHSISYSTGEWNGHVRLEGYYGFDPKKNTFSTEAGNPAAIRERMTDAKHHRFRYISREASKYSYMMGVGCFPASNSTDYRIKYTASSADNTMDTIHWANNNAGVMMGAAWFANGEFAGPGTEWYQIEMESATLINSITTTGGGSQLPYWVTAYKFTYSMDRDTWTHYLDDANYEKVFTGNVDGVAPVTHALRRRYEGKFFRIYPQEWHGKLALRVELGRCVVCGDGYVRERREAERERGRHGERERERER